jgi:hypothetical protein
MKELNQEYEIVDLDELHGEIHYQLYVRLASGEIKKAEYLHRTEMIGVHVLGDRYDIGKHYLEAFGIELLRVAPKTPLSFDETFEFVNGAWTPQRLLPFGFAAGDRPTKRFRVTEIMGGDVKGWG